MAVSQNNDLPLITIITATYNCKASLKKTAQSIRSQTYTHIQWIAADGASTDGTLNVIKDNLDIIDTYFSEPDTGIYHAWNKACKFIRGDWVLFLGAGDTLYNHQTLEIVSSKLACLNQDIALAYGNVFQIDDTGKIIYCYREVDLKTYELYRPTLPCHPGILERTVCLNANLPFDEKYKIVSDSKHLLLILAKNKYYYLDENITNMEMGGLSSHPRYATKVMLELLKLGTELQFKLPLHYKIKYIFISLIKTTIAIILGKKAISFFYRLKKCLF